MLHKQPVSTGLVQAEKNDKYIRLEMEDVLNLSDWH